MAEGYMEGRVGLGVELDGFRGGGERRVRVARGVDMEEGERKRGESRRGKGETTRE